MPGEPIPDYASLITPAGDPNLGDTNLSGTQNQQLHQPLDSQLQEHQPPLQSLQEEHYNGNDNRPLQENSQYQMPIPQLIPVAPLDVDAGASLINDPYISYTSDVDCPVKQERIKEIFYELRDVFGFQQASVDNMLDHLLVQLDSRSSRTASDNALRLLHFDYIGGTNANYRKWYFCSQLNDDPELIENIDLKLIKKTKKKSKSFQDISEPDFHPNRKIDVIEYRWKQRMFDLTFEDMIYDLALYLLIWGEANNIRFTPECICFIFKCAHDHLHYRKSHPELEIANFPEKHYLEKVINPLYNFIRDQQFKLKDDKYVRRERDHHLIIGYDDVNQLFWYEKGIKRIVLYDGSKLLLKPKHERYCFLEQVKWKKAFYKTYKERRTWWHLATNFSRIWIIHLSVFWYYSSFNSPSIYTYRYVQLLDNRPLTQDTFSVVALGGTISCIIQILATFSEWMFVPPQWPGSKSVTKRLFILFLITAINFGPSVFILFIVPLNAYSPTALILSICQFIISLLTTVWFAFQPLGSLFDFSSGKNRIGYDATKTFTASFPELDHQGKSLSKVLWILVFGAKYIESYFFLTLSLRDPIRNLFTMDLTRCNGEAWLGKILCQNQSWFAIILMYVTDLVLFFLDTYLWYIIWNCFFSIILSFSSGMSILSPWRNVFTRLPERIYSKLLSTKDMAMEVDRTELVSQVWNGIVISMYREHLLSVDHVHRLIYEEVASSVNCEVTIRDPSFFVFQDDSSQSLSNYFVPNSEAERRISFFAQSLSTSIPAPLPVEAMPSFTVLIPHYSEKIILDLKEIIKEDPKSKMTLLEYLKQIYPHEWECFVRDTKIINYAVDSARALEDEKRKQKEDEKNGIKEDKAEPDQEAVKLERKQKYIKDAIEDLPLYCIGYKQSAPEYSLRTRIWASLRTQTLYRTISGFMNYQRAIKMVHRIENPEIIEAYGSAIEAEEFYSSVAKRKFKLIVSMQRYQDFNESEKADVQVLVKSYPNILIASLEKEREENATQDTYYSVLYQAVVISKKIGANNEEINTDGEGANSSHKTKLIKQVKIKPVYKIQLSGNPILGDGKSDNQNHALIFYRGEYIQVIDANQDNYLEECMKIRSALYEFEEMEYKLVNPYLPTLPPSEGCPVAILGAREYIFSENTGVLGDVAASKEQTFGTLFARTLAAIGGKLHYGHPDFLNAIFMTTRGGISKAQKGLHLNEDIYAGMTAISRGGRIKHCDYYQCGKGRDLGFSSIMNFTTKIGGGMGEQMLSREYYYLGTQLPLDRFLSFYYAHPGFHLNNLFIMLSLQIFMLVVITLGAMNHELISCMYDKDVPHTDLQEPLGCQNLQPVLDWITRYVLSIFICFFISFLPLVLHELSERGPWKAFGRLLSHFVSLSPLFEVFVCQVYSNSLKSDIVFGGARYISSGRNFAITRNTFAHLYGTYANTSIYSGARLFLILLFATATMWQPAILWFWITLISMCLSPFIFNPHQFSWTEFFVDYGEFIKWMTRGNVKHHMNSWINFTRYSRSRFTGYRRSVITGKASVHRAPFSNTLFAELGLPFLQAVFIFLAYTFINAQTGVKGVEPTNSLLRMIIIVFAPIIINSVILLIVFLISCTAGALIGFCCSNVANVLAGLAHGISIFIHIIIFEAIWVLEGFNFGRTLCAIICGIFIQRVIFQSIKMFMLSREYQEDHTNSAWWSGRWITRGLGWHILTQPIREYLVKIVEMSLFVVDFLIVHLILITLTPVLFVPYVDHWHTSMLMWISPSKSLRGPIVKVSQRKARSRRVKRNAFLYFSLIIIFGVLITTPILVERLEPVYSTIDDILPKNSFGLIQANHQDNNDTGENAPDHVLRSKPEAPEIVTYGF